MGKIQIEEHAIVANLKSMLDGITGGPIRAQRLVHGTEVMRDADLLSKYGLREQPLINLVKLPCATERAPPFYVSFKEGSDAAEHI